MSNVENFLKSSIGLKDIAFWNLPMFLKIVTKWRHIWKSELNNFLTNWAFEKFFSRLTLSFHGLSELLICYAISWNLTFTVNLETSFSCKLWAQLDKNCKTSSQMAPLGVLFTRRDLYKTDHYFIPRIAQIHWITFLSSRKVIFIPLALYRRYISNSATQILAVQKYSLSVRL